MAVPMWQADRTQPALAERRSCRRCGADIVHGEPQFPIEGIGRMHLACAQAHCAALGLTLQPPVCKHWRRRGACAFQAQCFFRHPPEAAPKPDALAEARDLPSKVRAAAKAAAASRSVAWRAWNLGRAAMDESGRPHREAGGRAAAGPSASLGDPAGLPTASSFGASADARGNAGTQFERPATQGAGAGVATPGRSGASAAARGGSGEQAIGSGAPAGGDVPEQPVRAAARRRPRGTGCPTAASEEGPRCRIRNAFRASVFRRWLLDTFGRDALAAGAGVLDVADGKGALAFELANLNGLPATVLDPRPLALGRHILLLQARLSGLLRVGGFLHRNAAFLSYVDRSLAACLASGPILPGHLRLAASPPLAAACLASCGAARASVECLVFEGLQDALSPRWLHAARSHEADSNAAPDSDDDGKPADFSAGAAPTGRALLRRCIDAGSGAAPGSHSGKLMEHGATAPVTLRSYLRRCNEASHGAAPDSTGGEPALHGAAASEQPVSAGAEDLHSCVVKDGYVPGVEAGGQRPDGSGGGEAPRREVAAAGMQGAAEAVQRVLQECSVVAAMHPDQATEFAIDLAQLGRKPFAIVPCCVHAQAFPERRLPDGRPVCSYEELIEYLVARDPAIRVAELPFEGRKRVVYCTAWT